MNSKVKLVLVIVLIIISFVTGVFVGNNKSIKKEKVETNKIRYNLDGIYLTDRKETTSSQTLVKHSYIDTITFYTNGTASIYRINIYDIKGIGTQIEKGTINSGSYTLSNESKTILIRQENVNKTLTFENDYKTVKNDNGTYNLATGNIEDYLPKETVNNERNTDFSGEYVWEEIAYKKTEGSSTIVNGKTIQQRINKKYLTFFENGKLKIRYEDITEFTDGTSKNDKGGSYEYSYSIDKENKTILVYMSTSTYFEYTINEDLNEIKDTDKLVYKLVK